MAARCIEIEPAFDSFVRSFGGVVLSDKIGVNPTFENADYVFPDQEIVAELKCLKVNKLNDPTYMGKIADLWQRWRNSGFVTGDTPETILLNELPPQCASELVSVTSRPLKRVIEKANRQIRETKATLNLPSYKGLLLLANDGNFALPPNTLHQLVGEVLTDSYTSINCFVLFSVNMIAQVPKVEFPCRVWMPNFRSESESIPSDVMGSIRDGWHEFHEKITDQTYRRFGDTGNA